jgi:[acyl-carrier-protein] S-malonyltransferase
MSQSLYILCPGQGAQVVGMGKDLYESSQAAKDTFDAANRVLGSDLAALCFTGPQERLDQTDISQPAIYVTSVASFRAAKEAAAIDPAQVTAYAGLSLGEYTALHLAGVFGFEEGLKLVAARGRYMQEAAVATPSGMIALVGADKAAAQKICDEAAQGEVLVPANFNAPGQIVISGSKAACDRAEPLIAAAGFRGVRLAVAGAFHSPLMQSGADRMKAELDRVVFRPAEKPVFSNVTAAIHGNGDSIKKLLVDQIVSPVLWEETMVKLIGDGADRRFIELAPARALAGMAKKINRRLPVENVNELVSASAKA